MRYLKVTWNHALPEEPVTLYSECDDAGWERRKVEVFRGGRFGYASATGEHGGTVLGLAPVPDIADIEADPAFSPVEITSDAFEEIWRSVQMGVAAE